MNRIMLEEAARWNSLLKAIEMHRENKGKYPGYPFHDVFMYVSDPNIQAEILKMVELRAREVLSTKGVCESLHGAPLETIEAHKVEVRLGIRLQYAEQKIRELEERLNEDKELMKRIKKWWSA